MFTTLRSKMILLITVVMGITAITVMYFTHRDVRQVMLNAEEHSARNVLELAELNIRGGYNRLISDKIEILSGLKDELRHITTLAASVLREYRALGERGALSEEEARSLALDWIRTFNFAKGELFVFGPDGIILADSDRSVEGASLASLRDLKGRLLAEDMRYDELGPTGDSAVFVWAHEGRDPRGKNMGYFLPIAGWNWTLGGLIDFENIEAESQRKLAAIVEVLKKTFQKIRIGETGYVFLFSGNHELLIPPPGVRSEMLSNVMERQLEELASAAKQGETSVRYLDPFADNSVLVEAFSTYFKAFDWYLAVVAPVHEIQKPAEDLLASQSLIIGFVFLGALLAAFLMVTKISRPLKILTSYAKTLSSQDFTKEWGDEDRSIRELAAKYNEDEVGRLAKAFSFMETELKKNVRHAIASTAARERLRAKDEFLANMSHEMRTPIHGILGMTELLLEGKLSTKQQRFAEIIRGSGKSLLSLIDDILDFSKIEASKLELEATSFNLGDLVEDVAEHFAETAQSKGLELICSVAPVCYGSFQGDPARLRQILVNLCGNAVKFTDAGQIVIRVFADLRLGRDWQVQFVVSDTGIGMSPEQQARIFEPFVQADNTTTRRYGGSGLGLAISKRLVELMHGQLDVESALNRGTTFRFSAAFPKVTTERSGAPATTPSPMVSRVLMVHHNPTSSEILRERIESFGVDVVVVTSATDAVGRLRLCAESETPFDMAFIDQCLDGIDAFQLARIIRKDRGLSGVRIVLMVPMIGSDVPEREAAGLDAICLTKPIRQTVLRECLTGAEVYEVAGRSTSAAIEKENNESASSLRAHVLVAEDNPLNQVLTQEMLKESGCQVTIVEDGRKALEALDGDSIDLILMDCQMPEMDGYEATREIRRREAEHRGERRIPIIALTANAMRGDPEKCGAAGMDDYLSKPFSSSELLDKLEHWLKSPSNEIVPPDESAPSTAPVTNFVALSDHNGMCLDQAALDRIRSVDHDGSNGLLSRLIEIYFEHSPKLVEQIRIGIDANEPDTVRNAVHTLKSNSANLGAEELAGICKELEEKARAKELAGADELLACIESMLPVVFEQLTEESPETVA